eukprot:5312524-Pleurochrysis_carterae.AAC.3
MGYEWTEEEGEAFEVEAVVGKVVADGKTAYAIQGRVAAGIDHCPLPHRVTRIRTRHDLRRELEQSLAADAAADEASAREGAELTDLKELERMPAA